MNRSHQHLNRQPRLAAGFSIVELLIAVMIIAILALLLVPTVNRRAHEARLAAAQRELEAIATAEERVAADIGYYVRLFMLDDVARGDGRGLGNAADVHDGIGDEYKLNEYYRNSDRLFFLPTDHHLLTDQETENVLETVFKFEDAQNSGETNYTPVWSGPYYTIHRDESFPWVGPIINPNLYQQNPGIPTDPWGRDYLLIMPGEPGTGLNGGFVLEPDGVVFEQHTFGGIQASATNFDRPAIVSFGPDSLPGDGAGLPLGEGDDLVREFGY